MDKQIIVDELIDAVEDLLEDEDYSTYTRRRLEEMLEALRDEVDFSLRADRCREILSDIDENPSTPTHVRTQLWNIVVCLDML